MFKLRFWWVMLKSLFTHSGAQGKIGFLVWPWDCDLNLHLNNGNYLRFMDLGRWHWAMSSGTLWPMWKNGLRPMAVGVDIRFKRALPPFARFRLITSLDSAAGKTVRIAQRFYRSETEVAEAFVTVVFVRNGRALELEKVAPYLPRAWQEKVKELKSSSAVQEKKGPGAEKGGE